MNNVISMWFGIYCKNHHRIDIATVTGICVGSQGNVREKSGNFFLPTPWQPWLIWLPVSLSVSVSVSLCLSLCLCPPPPPVIDSTLFLCLFLCICRSSLHHPHPPQCRTASVPTPISDSVIVPVSILYPSWTSLSKSVCVCVCPSGNNERNGVSNHRCIDCLPNRLFRCKSKKTSKPRVTGLCEVTGEFPAQRARNAENFPIWWRHRVCYWFDPVSVSPCFCLCLPASVCCLCLSIEKLLCLSR